MRREGRKKKRGREPKDERRGVLLNSNCGRCGGRATDRVEDMMNSTPPLPATLFFREMPTEGAETQRPRPHCLAPPALSLNVPFYWGSPRLVVRHYPPSLQTQRKKIMGTKQSNNRETAKAPLYQNENTNLRGRRRGVHVKRTKETGTTGVNLWSIPKTKRRGRQAMGGV